MNCVMAELTRKERVTGLHLSFCATLCGLALRLELRRPKERARQATAVFVYRGSARDGNVVAMGCTFA